MNPGELKDLINVLELSNSENTFSWETKYITRGKVEQLTGKNYSKNIFSKVGIGAKSVKFTVRKQQITLHNAFKWGNKHCFLTDINEINRLYYEVTAALVNTVVCVIKREGEPTYDDFNRPVYSEPVLIKFPAILTEKYLGNTQSEPMTTIETRYILVTPKLITLQEGEIVTIDETPYSILLAHTLDEYKNEYEIRTNKNT